eukprot:3627243-Prymnesium_polylepis.1
MREHWREWDSSVTSDLLRNMCDRNTCDPGLRGETRIEIRHTAVNVCRIRSAPAPGSVHGRAGVHSEASGRVGEFDQRRRMDGGEAGDGTGRQDVLWWAQVGLRREMWRAVVAWAR